MSVGCYRCRENWKGLQDLLERHTSFLLELRRVTELVLYCRVALMRNCPKGICAYVGEVGFVIISEENRLHCAVARLIVGQEAVNLPSC